jgi:hypothetical protein
MNKQINQTSSTDSSLNFYEEAFDRKIHSRIDRFWVDSDLIPDDISSISLSNNIYSKNKNNTTINVITKYSLVELIKIAGTKASYTTMNFSIKSFFIKI